MPKKYKYAEHVKINGKDYYIRANTLDELARKIEKKRKEADESLHKVEPGITLSQWANICVDTYKTGQKDITRKKYISRINKCVLSEIGHMPIASIKPLHCQQVINKQIGKSKTQINEVYSALKFIFKYACLNHIIDSDPTEGLQKPAGTKTHRRPLTATERKAFIAVGMTDRRYYLFLLMLYCGCRPSEAENAMGKDIVIRKGYPMLHIRGTKTANADRYVPIPIEFFDIIKDTQPKEYIACHSTGTKIGFKYRTRIWESYKRQLNIHMGCRVYRNALVPPYPLAPDLVPYCLRHEYCTELARQGIDIRVAQKLMGHSDMSLTANIYTNLGNDDILSVADRLCGLGKANETDESNPDNNLMILR